MTDEQKKKIEEQFHARLLAHDIDPATPKGRKSAKALKMQAEFFTGAMAAQVAFEGQEAKLSPHWVISIMSSRSILDPIG